MDQICPYSNFHLHTAWQQFDFKINVKSRWPCYITLLLLSRADKGGGGEWRGVTEISHAIIYQDHHLLHPLMSILTQNVFVITYCTY